VQGLHIATGTESLLAAAVNQDGTNLRVVAPHVQLFL